MYSVNDVKILQDTVKMKIKSTCLFSTSGSKWAHTFLSFFFFKGNVILVYTAYTLMNQ